MENHGIEHAEDDDIGADAKCEREDGGEREPGRATNLTRCVTDVAAQAGQAERGVGCGDALFCTRWVAEAKKGFTLCIGG